MVMVFGDLSGTNNVLYDCISFTEVTDRVGGYVPPVYRRYNEGTD